MNKINNIPDISIFFSFLNNEHIKYVWLHNYNNEILGDFDIAVSEKDFYQIERIINEFCVAHNFKLLQIIQHEFCAKYFVLGKINNCGIEFLIPDICSHYVRNGRIFLTADELLKNKIFNGNFYRCNDLIEAEYIFLKRSLKKFWESSHLNNFKNIFERNYSILSRHLEKYLGKKLKKEFINLIKDDDITELNSRVRELRQSILCKTFFNNPFQSIYYHLNNFLRILKRILHPTGLFIAIIGTDGAGKSTIIKELNNILNPAFRKIKKYHWKPILFKKNKNNVVIEPHKNPPRNFIFSFIKLLIYVLQYLIGYLFIIYPLKIKSTLIIFDRYYYDMIVDQKRFRLNLPQKIIKFYSIFIPKPDLIFYLRTKPSVALERKNELNLEELERQNKEFAALIDLLNDRFIFIDNNEDINYAVYKITSDLFNYLEKRVNSR